MATTPSEVIILEDELPEDDYYNDEPMPAHGWCGDYEVHSRHFYTAINCEVYDCSGLTDEDLAEVEAGNALPPCEHGLSSDLCAGPGHYPMDRY